MWHIPSAMAKTKAAEFAKKERQKLQEQQEQAERDREWDKPISRAPSSRPPTEDAETQTDSDRPASHPGGGRFAFLARSVSAETANGLSIREQAFRPVSFWNL